MSGLGVEGGVRLPIIVRLLVHAHFATLVCLYVFHFLPIDVAPLTLWVFCSASASIRASSSPSKAALPNDRSRSQTKGTAVTLAMPCAVLTGRPVLSMHKHVVAGDRQETFHSGRIAIMVR
jgi:hypothetical protein